MFILVFLCHLCQSFSFSYSICSTVASGFGVGEGVSSTMTDISMGFEPSCNLSVHTNECEAQWGIRRSRRDDIQSGTSSPKAKMTQLKISHGICNNSLYSKYKYCNKSYNLCHLFSWMVVSLVFKYESLVNSDNLNIKLMVECVISNLGVVIS